MCHGVPSISVPYFSIVANGTATVDEEPTYALLLNRTKHRVERLEKALERLIEACPMWMKQGPDASRAMTEARAVVSGSVSKREQNDSVQPQPTA